MNKGHVALKPFDRKELDIRNQNQKLLTAENAETRKTSSQRKPGKKTRVWLSVYLSVNAAFLFKGRPHQGLR